MSLSYIIPALSFCQNRALFLALVYEPSKISGLTDMYSVLSAQWRIGNVSVAVAVAHRPVFAMGGRFDLLLHCLLTASLWVR